MILKVLFQLFLLNKISKIDGWMDDLRFIVLLNSISVRLGQRAGDNEWLCAMEPRLRLKRSSPQSGMELGTARSAGQRLTH